MGSPPGWRRFRRMLATTALMASSAAVSGPQQPFPAAAGGSSSRAQSTVRQLCPATLDPKAYDKTGYRMLRPGYGDWVFRDMVELRRSDEHTSELQSLMRISYAVFCLKEKTQHTFSRLPH